MEPRQTGILERITDNYNVLTRSGKKLADYILLHCTEAQYMSITALADECGVAEATITRFCRTLGFSGYNQLKLALAKSDAPMPIAYDAASMGSHIQPDDTLKDMCKKLYSANVASLGQTLAQIDDAAVERAVEYISAARAVYCFGQGGSMVMAMEAWARFITAVPYFHCVEDAHLQAMTASLCRPEDVILFFSYSGATRDMLDVLRPAREQGAKIILVSHHAKSPAVALSDVVLLCGAPENPLQSGSVSAKMSLLFIIDILFNEYCRKHPQLSQRNCERTVESIAGKLL
jgi:DNA-binding MurR/RpiR family transcriptional regulator